MLDCKLRSSFLLASLWRILEEIGAEVEVNPDDFYQCKDVITRRFRSRDYNFPESVSYRAWGVRYSLYITLVIEGSLLGGIARIVEVSFVSSS